MISIKLLSLFPSDRHVKDFNSPPKDEKGGDEGLIAFHGEIVYGRETQKIFIGKNGGREIKTI